MLSHVAQLGNKFSQNLLAPYQFCDSQNPEQGQTRFFLDLFHLQI